MMLENRTVVDEEWAWNENTMRDWNRYYEAEAEKADAEYEDNCED